MQTLRGSADAFLEWIDSCPLSPKTRRYYRNGIRLLLNTTLAKFPLRKIGQLEFAALTVPGSTSNANNALRTLHRLLWWAHQQGMIRELPKVPTRKEARRELLIGNKEERKIRASGFQPLNDVLFIMRRMGMRNESEVLCMRWENVRWLTNDVFVPDGKTVEARRYVPMPRTVRKLLKSRNPQKSGWVFPSKGNCRFATSRTGHTLSVAKQFARARERVGLPKELKLYCARHDFGTYTLEKTGNLAVVMKVMGHTDVSSALRYQHPNVQLVLKAINQRDANAG